MRTPRLVMLGKQGAGKGTQAERVADYYGIVHLSTGDLFRRQAESGSAFALEAKRYMDAGELVPDDIVIGVVEECLRDGGPLSGGFVLDGFPRTTEQADALERLLGERPLDIVVHLEVAREIVVERMRSRAREDDTDDAIERRLELYDRETRPIIEYYEDLGRIVEIDGVGSLEEVFERIVGAVDGRSAVSAG